MEAAIAAAMFLGLPVALWLLVRRTRRKAQRSSGGWLEPRVAELEALAESQGRWVETVEERLADLEQTQAPLYRGPASPRSSSGARWPML